MRLKLFLFLIIFIEGYVVLSTELLALRLVIPFIGNATDTIAIIIAAVLMPLALGYYVGGAARPPFRKKLLVNLTVAAVILTFGLSHGVLKLFFEYWNFANTAPGRLLATSAYGLLFLVVPIFLLGQTVPLVSHYLRSANLARMTGVILFFSTLGSFMGAVFCTIVLMPVIGVHHSVSVTLCGIATLVLMLTQRFPDKYSVTVICMVILSLMVNSGEMMRRLNIVSNNQYNTVQVYRATDDSARFMRINNTFASATYTDPQHSDDAVFGYIDYIEKNFITPTLKTGTKKDILVLGGGGLTVGLKDTQNTYTFIDIDPALESAAQDYLLGRKLSPNKKFLAEEARSFIAGTAQKFDLIFIDLYQAKSGPPAHVITQEFYAQLKKTLKPGGIVTANLIASPTFSDTFSIRLDHTIRSVFPLTSRHIIGNYDGWNTSPEGAVNLIYVMYPEPQGVDGIYTDNLNPAFLDHGKAP